MRQKRRKRILSLLLAACLILSNLLVYLPQMTLEAEAESAQSTTLYEENFENCEQPLTEWAENVDKAEKSLAKENEDQVLKITYNKENDVSWVPQYMFQSIPEDCKKVKLTYQIKVESNGAFIFLPSLCGTQGRGEKIGQLAVNGGKLKKINASGGWDVLSPEKTLSNGTWYTIAQIVDLEAETYDLYIDNALILEKESIADNKKSIKGITFGCYKLANYCFYLDDIRAEIVNDSTSEGNNDESIYQQNFEKITLEEFQAAWTKNANRTENTETIEITEDGTTGKVLKIKHIPAQVSLRMDHNFETQTYKKAVLKYRAKLENKNGTITLPGFKNSKGLIGQVAIQDGKVKKYTPDWTAIDFSFETGKWYEFEQVIDTEKGVYDFYIDGKAVIVQEKIHEELADLSGLSFSIYKTTDNTLYLDDLCAQTYVQGTSIAFEKESYCAYVGAAPIELKLIVTPEDTSSRLVTYRSSDETVATVDSNGKVTGLKEGKTTITATPYDESLTPATTTVRVEKMAITSFSVTPTTISLAEGGHTKLTVTAEPQEVLTQGVNYVSADTKIATVDEWGQIVAVKEGTTTITVSSAAFPDRKADVTVTVTKAAVQQTIYVSPDGTGEGTSKAAPCDLQAAMTKISEIDKTAMTGDIVVELAEGYYKQSSTLKFTKAHGGNNEHYVIYRAAKGAEVTIGGAKEITETFSKVDGKDYYVAQLSDKIDTRQIYVDNIRATRARSTGELKNASLLMDDTGNCIGFTCENTELLEIPKANQADLELVFLVMWSNSRCGVSEIVDAGNGKVNLIMDQPGFGYTYNKGNTSSKNSLTDPYTLYYENALMLLDEPGEWYFDAATNKLYYMPYSWQDMDDVTVTYPSIDDFVQNGEGGLVTIFGETAADKVQNIKFEGITFADTTWTRPNTTNGHSETQNNHIREASTKYEDRLADAAITVKLANSIHFTGCVFTRLGITGIKMVEGVENSRIEGNQFYDISGGAINIGDPDFTDPNVCNPSDPDMIMKNFEVSNNYIHDIGVDYRSAAAISFGYVTNANSVHNEIFDIPYSGYHIGYGWDDEFENVLKNVTIAENFIHDYMGAGIHDGGGIYTLGNSAGNNVVCDNYIKNQKNGNSALYPDNGTSLWTWENNVVDLTETPIWPYSGEGGWYLLINSGDHDLTVRNNYSTTTSWHQANGMDFEELNITLENTMVFEDANWPEDVKKIIQKSGMENAYAGIRNDQAERLVTNLPKEGEILSLAADDVFDIGLYATDGKDQKVSMKDYTITYETEDPSVAEVSKDGKIIAKAKGETTLRIYVVSNHIVKKIERTIYVGDQLKEVYIKNVKADTLSLTTSRSTQISVYGVTEKGREIKLSDVTYHLSDQGIVTVDDQGTITPIAVGITKLTISGTLEGVTKSKTYTIEVSKAAEFKSDNMEELYQESNQSAWVGAAASSVQVTDKTEINASLSNWTTYTGKKFYNELLCFQMSLDAKGTWPSIVLRAQDSEGYVAGGTTGYIICMGDAGIQVQRFNGKTRTVFYGEVEGVPGIYGGNITNHGLEDRKLHEIQVGALTDGNSVRLYMSIDGKVIFDILDESEDAILEEGYFGLVGRNGDTFRFVRVEQPENPIPEDPSPENPSPDTPPADTPSGTDNKKNDAQETAKKVETVMAPGVNSGDPAQTLLWTGIAASMLLVPAVWKNRRKER